VVEAPAGEVPGRKALDQHVGGVDELEETIAIRRRVEVEHDAALAPVGHDRPDVRPLRVAPGGLDLHHVGTVVAEHHGRERSRESGGQIDDPETFERAGHRASWRSAVG
jgi:hypothetical protein